MTLTEPPLMLGESLDQISELAEERGLLESDLTWLYPSVSDANNNDILRLIQMLVDTEEKFPIHFEGNILDKIMHDIFFDCKTNYKSGGVSLDQVLEDWENRFPEYSELRVALEELDWWAFK